MSATATTTLPLRWQLSNVFSGLGNDDYRAGFNQLLTTLNDLEQLFEDALICSEPRDASAAELAEDLEKIITLSNTFIRQEATLAAYVHSFVSTDSHNAMAARELSKLEALSPRQQQLFVRLTSWLGALANQLDGMLEAAPQLRHYNYFLRRQVAASQHLMDEQLEALAAQLVIDGADAFGKLQGNVTSQLTVAFELDGKTETLPIAAIRNLSSHADATVRKRAHKAELEAWGSVRTSIAAALNAVKGTSLTLAKRRQWPSVLDWALFNNRIDRPTLNALWEAVREAFPIFRRYLRSKAKKLGKDQLAWWDLAAPVGASTKKFTWEGCRDFVVEQFATFDADLAAFAASAFEQGWLDAEPRAGKRGGGFCMGVLGVEESRILVNFDGSFSQVSTVAHELGHAYHNHCQNGLEPLRRGAPMVLAETASTFCETLICEAALAEASDDEKLAILEAQLEGVTGVCLDIYSRFLFESWVLERRDDSELSADELCELMRKAQAETYGDAVDPSTYHPYMWLWKPHYYSYGGSFYNYPYAFGHLFGLGLYARYQADGDPFIPRYKGLLKATGTNDAAPLAEGFGIDIRNADFWRASLKVVADQVARYEQL